MSKSRMDATQITEITYLVLCFLIGAPLNLVGFITLTRQCKRGVLRRSDIMKRHLNYSDLLITLLYIPSQLAMLIFGWTGVGAVTCKFVKFAQMLCFQMNISMLCAWVYSALACSPQFIVFEEYEPFKNYKVCLTTWHITRLRAYFEQKNNSVGLNGTQFYNESTQINSTQPTIVKSRFLMESVYGYFCQTSNFLLPCLIVLLVYMFIAVWLCKKTEEGIFPDFKTYFPRINKYWKGSAIPGTRKTTLLNENKEVALQSASRRSNSSTKICFNPVVEEIYEFDQDAPPCNVVNLDAHKVTRSLKHDPRQEDRLKSKRKNRRAIRLSAIICLTHLILWIPYNVVTTVHIVVPDLSNIHIWSHIAHNMIVVTAVFDPLLYGISICKYPNLFDIAHILTIWRFDTETKTWSNRRYSNRTACKYWSFAVIPRTPSQPAMLLILAHGKYMIGFNLIPLCNKPGEERKHVIKPRVFWGSPRLSKLTAEIVNVPGRNDVMNNRFAQFLIIFGKEGDPKTRWVYRLAVDKTVMVRPWAQWSPELHNSGILGRSLLSAQPVAMMRSTWAARPSPLSTNRRKNDRGWKLAPTAPVKNGPRAGTTLISANGGSMLSMYGAPISLKKHVPLDEMICSICYYHPTNADQLLNKDTWVRLCNCMGYCHQECADRYVLMVNRNNYWWRAANNRLYGGWRVWQQWQNTFLCIICLQRCPNVLGHVRPIQQVVQVAKGLLNDNYHWIMQLHVIVLMLCTLLLAKYPSVQSYLRTVVWALLEHCYYRIACPLDPQWSLHYAICSLEALFLMHVAAAPNMADVRNFTVVAVQSLVLLSHPLIAFVTMCYVEVVILGPHVCAMFKAKFINAPRPAIRRSKSLTDMSTCQVY